jgi:multisubunit Na+/H+ antiporter MnhB subunit
MKRYLMSAALLFLAAMGLFYLLWSFIALSFNPAQWRLEGRVLYAAVGLIVILGVLKNLPNSERNPERSVATMLNRITTDHKQKQA